MEAAIARILKSYGEPWLDLGTEFTLFLDDLSNNKLKFTIEKFIAALQSTTTLERLDLWCVGYESTPENNRRVIEPLCRGIANLRHHNSNHPLRHLRIESANTIEIVDQFLASAKQFGIHHLSTQCMRLPIQSLVEFGRDNNHLRGLNFFRTSFYDKEVSTASTTPKDGGPQDSFAILTLNEIHLVDVGLDNALVVNKFLKLISHVTYRVLVLGKITVAVFDNNGWEIPHEVADEGEHGNDDDKEEKKIAHRRIMSALFKPSSKYLILTRDGGIDAMDAIEACATVIQIQLSEDETLHDYETDDVYQKLQAIASRNRQLARFLANPHGYPRSSLLALMRQFDSIPTGRYMLACALPEVPSFFKIKSTGGSATVGPKKKRRKW